MNDLLSHQLSPFFTSLTLILRLPPALQLLADHPHLASIESSKLLQLTTALGAAPQQQQPLLLRAAATALAAKELPRAEHLLLMLVAQQYT